MLPESFFTDRDYPPDYVPHVLRRPNLVLSFEFFHAELYTKESPFPYHSHSNIEIHYIAQGRGIIELGDTRFLVEAGDFFVVAPGLLHAEWPEPGSRFVQYVTRFYMEVYATHGLFRSTHRRLEPDFEAWFHMSQVLNAPTPKIFRNASEVGESFEAILISQVIQGTAPIPEDTMLRLFLSSVELLDRQQSKTVLPAGTMMSDVTMKKIRNFIRSNINRPISVSNLSRELELDSRALYRVIKKHTGKSPQQFILFFRCEQALVLIMTTDRSLRWIADTCGFSDAAHLSRSFKTLYGRLPKEFR